MAPHLKRLLVLLLVALTLSSASANSGVFVRFKLVEPTETSYYLQIGGYLLAAGRSRPGAGSRDTPGPNRLGTATPRAASVRVRRSKATPATRRAAIRA